MKLEGRGVLSRVRIQLRLMNPKKDETSRRISGELTAPMRCNTTKGEDLKLLNLTLESQNSHFGTFIFSKLHNLLQASYQKTIPDCKRYDFMKNNWSTHNRQTDYLIFN